MTMNNPSLVINTPITQAVTTEQNVMTQQVKIPKITSSMNSPS